MTKGSRKVGDILSRLQPGLMVPLIGPFGPEELTTWEKSDWLRPDLHLNRPNYDTVFLPLSTWKAKMNEVLKVDGEDKGLFFTWFEPVHETRPPSPPKVIQPPPGLSRHDTLPVQDHQNPSPPLQQAQEPPKPDAAAPPSVFEVLRRADHAPSPVFGEGGFSHSPANSHRQPMKGPGAVLESAHTSSPSSSTANTFGEEFAGGMRQSNSAGMFHQGMSYVPHNSLPASLVKGLPNTNTPSPLVGHGSPIVGSFSAGGGGNSSEQGSLGVQPSYSTAQAGNVFASIRKHSYDQYPSSNASWQSGVQNHGLGHRGSSLVSGMAGAGVAPTSSSTSSLSNAPRAQFGDRRSPSPTGFFGGAVNGGFTSSLGGEVYEGTLSGPVFHTAIGRIDTRDIPVSGGNYSPQQQYGTSYRSPVPPIPETIPGTTAGIGSGPEPGAQQVNANGTPHSNIYGQGPVAMATDVSVALPRKPSLEPMTPWTTGQQQHVQQQQEPRSRFLPLEMQPSLSGGLHTQPSSDSLNRQAVKEEKEGETANSITTQKIDIAKPKPSPIEQIRGDNDDDSKPFTTVKRQHRTPGAHPIEPPPAPVPSARFSNSNLSPSISQSSSKMNVPLASLITNPPLAANPAPAKAWATVSAKDETKGLREIQEAEERQAKENEKLKARSSTISPVLSPGGAASAKDEDVGTLLTWGLPTSLAGARGGKDATTSSSTATATQPAAVWAGGGAAKVAGSAVGNGTKKTTMKDIQEEEKRKKKERETPTAAKRVGEKVGFYLSLHERIS